MSSTNRKRSDGSGAGYEALARYYTSNALTRVLIDLLPIQRYDRVIEGHVGGESWVRALFHRSLARGWQTPTVAVNDIDPKAPGLLSTLPTHKSHGSFLDYRPPWDPDWAIGNPPYAIPIPQFHADGSPKLDKDGKQKVIVTPVAEDHVRKALVLTKPRQGSVAFLLRLNFLGSLERAALWQDYPLRKVWVLSQRPSYTDDGGTDSTEYGLFWWQHGFRGETTLEMIPWR